MSLADLPLHLGELGDLPADDLALLRLYAEEKNQAAFAELVSRHADWIRSACRRALRDKDLADDAVQAVFIILARKADCLPDGTRVSGWLYRTTRFVISDIRKRETRHRRRYQMAMRAAIERGYDSSMYDPANNGVHEFVAKVLASLPEHERQAVAMHFFDGLTFREIGEALGLSRDGAKKRVARALARLRSSSAIKGLTIVATTVAAAILRSATTAQAVISTGAKIISAPSTLWQSLSNLVSGSAKALSGQISSNLAKLTVARAIATGAVVSTAVVCGTKLPTDSSNRTLSANRTTDLSSTPLTYSSRSNTAPSVAMRGLPNASNVAMESPALLPQISTPNTGLATAKASRGPQPVSRGSASAGGATRSVVDPYVLPPTVNRAAADRVNASPAALMASRGSGKADASASAGSDERDPAEGEVRHALEIASTTTDAETKPAGGSTTKVETRPVAPIAKLVVPTVGGDSPPAAPPMRQLRKADQVASSRQPEVLEDRGLLSAGGSNDGGTGTVVTDGCGLADAKIDGDGAHSVDHAVHNSASADNDKAKPERESVATKANPKGGGAKEKPRHDNQDEGGEIRGTLGHVEEPDATKTDQPGDADTGQQSNQCDGDHSDVIDANNHAVIDVPDRTHSHIGKRPDAEATVPNKPNEDAKRNDRRSEEPDEPQLSLRDGGPSGHSEIAADTMMRLLDFSGRVDDVELSSRLTSDDSAAPINRSGGALSISGLGGSGIETSGAGYFGQLVPEPASLGMLTGLAVIGLLRRRR